MFEFEIPFVFDEDVKPEVKKEREDLSRIPSDCVALARTMIINAIDLRTPGIKIGMGQVFYYDFPDIGTRYFLRNIHNSGSWLCEMTLDNLATMMRRKADFNHPTEFSTSQQVLTVNGRSGWLKSEGDEILYNLGDPTQVIDLRRN